MQNTSDKIIFQILQFLSFLSPMVKPHPRQKERFNKISMKKERRGKTEKIGSNRVFHLQAMCSFLGEQASRGSAINWLRNR